jgi:predicted ATPase/DNA-binding SARP family transcriptional activator
MLRDGAPLAHWPRPSTKRLLKLLALAPHRQMACAALVERMWPGDADVDARTKQRLHHQVYLLNQALGATERAVFIQQDCVRLSDKLTWWVDAAAFEQALEESIPASADTQSLVQALALYRGPLLPDEEGDEALAAQRNYLEQRHVNGLYALAARHAQSGDLLAACAALRRVLQTAPADEVAHRQLIEMYGRMGQLAQAEQQFADCKLALSRAFAASPGEATLLAYQQALQGVRAGMTTGASPTSAIQPVAAATRFAPPAPVVQLIGRDALVASCCEAVLGDAWRLHTLVGPGGVGKTQLAIRLAHELGSHFRHGACFVSLAEVRSDAVLDQIARALGVAEQPHKRLQESVHGFLADKHLLLVLDNFEHVMPAAELLAPLLAHCALLAVLATSRVRLNLAAEAVLDVPPLPAQASSQAAVQLFVRRATAVQPDFALTAGNTADAIAIAQRLGGLPLALELAAARMPLYGIAALREQLAQDVVNVVSGGGVDRPARHRSLEASLAWSYALLPLDQQRVLHRLALFVESFDLLQAQGLCTGLPGELSGAVQALLEAGLLTRVITSQEAAAPRFGLLALTQEFLARHPRSASESANDAQAFVAHQLLQAERLDALVEQGQAAAAVAAFDAARLSFFAALETAEQVGDGVSMARLVRRLVRCWSRASVFARAMPWAKRAREHVHLLPDAEQGWLLLMVGYFLVDHGEPAEGHDCAGQAIQQAERTNDKLLDARAALLYSGTAAAVGTPEVGIAALVRTQTYALGVADADLLHKASVNLGVCHLQCGDLAAARAQWLACDERLQDRRTQTRVSTSFNLALAAHYGGQTLEAMRLLDLAIELERCGQPQLNRLLHIQLRRAWMHCCNRDVDKARAALHDAQDIVHRASLANAQEVIGFLHGKIDLAQGNVAGALDRLGGAAVHRAGRADPWDLLDSRLWLFHALWAPPGNRARARAMLPALQNDVRGWRQEEPRVLEAVAMALCDEGRFEQATEAWQRAQAQRQASGLPRFKSEHDSVALTLNTLNQHLRVD